MERLNTAESAVFKYCRFPLFLKDLFSRLFCVVISADVNAKDRFDVTALHVAAEMGHFDCMKMLLDGCADCNIATKYSKHGSYTGKYYRTS